MNIGFIGVGNMGGPMCRNIIKKSGAAVQVFDVNVQAVQTCVDAGARSASSVAELAAACDVIFTSLPMPSLVESTILGSTGIAAHARPGTLVIDLSTNAPKLAKSVAAGLESRGLRFLESPVTGGTAKATDGSLTLMVGGERALFDATRDLLNSFSGQQLYTGPVGSASGVKLINNLLCMCNMATAVEGLVLGAKAGLDLNVLAEVIGNGTGNSAVFKAVVARGFKGDFKPNFAIDLAYKDVRLAMDMADEFGYPAGIGDEVLNVMKRARAMGFGGLDSTAMMKVYEAFANVEARS
jgi:2-hydroxy-3-oxopropionate reductase